MKTVKQIIIIIIAAILSFTAVKYIDLGTFFNILMFMGIYILTALAVEYISGILSKKVNRSKKKSR